MTPLELVPDRDGPRDECGVFGVYAPGRDVARLSYYALYSLQHRGQESAGIAVCDEGHITTLRDRGLVSQVFDEQKLRALPGQMAIGHVRYSTTGSSNWENSQPVHRSDRREVALGDRKSTRLNSSHQINSYAVFCLKKKNVNGLGIQSAWLDGASVVVGGDALPDCNGLQNAFARSRSAGRQFFLFRVPILGCCGLRK